MSSDEVKLLLNSDDSDEEFMKKYSDYDISDKDGLHQIAIGEILRIAQQGNLNDFVRLCKNLRRLRIILGKNIVILKSKNVLNNTNLVITACEYNSLPIVKELFKNEYWDLFGELGMEMQPDDRDKKQRDAFYYALKSGNVDLVRTLVEDWPGCHFSREADQLDQLISENYQLLRECGVPLKEELQSYIEELLLRLRFFSDCVVEEGRVAAEKTGVLERMQLLSEQVSLLSREFGGNNEVDSLFLFLGKSIAHNINILKQRLQSTYDKLPWEEIEFCLVSFILSYTKERKNNIYVNITLNKLKLIKYLTLFVGKLSEEREIIASKTINDLISLPELDRSDIIKKIQLSCPKFADLYADYKTIRDMDSLMRINEYIEVVERADVKTKQGLLEVYRGLQVMGEHLKCTLVSSKLSEDTSKEVIDVMSAEARKSVLEARDYLAHSVQPQISVHSVTRLQKEIRDLGYFVRKIICEKKFYIGRMLLEKILRSDNKEEMKETCLALTRIWNDGINFNRLEKQALELLKNFLDFVNYNLTKTESKNSHYTKLLDKIEKHIAFLDTNQSYYNFNLSIRLHDCMHKVDIDFKKSMGIFDCSHHIDIEKERIKYLCKYYLEINADNPHYSVFNVLNLTDLKNSLMASVDRLGSEEIERLNVFLALAIPKRSKMYYNICTIFKKLAKQNKKTKQRKENQLEITPKLTELNSTVYLFNSEISRKNDFSDIEMCLIEILTHSKRDISLENNINYTDGASPMLIGKNLRNHLAHDNLITHLSSDPNFSLKLNVKVLQELEFPVKRKIGKVVIENIDGLRERYEELLKELTNFELAIKEVKSGNISEFKSLIERGVDVSARSYDSRGFLHWAAECSNPEMVRTLLEMGVDVEEEDCGGQRALHLAAARGEPAIVELLLAAGAEVEAADRLGRRPLHLAADSGSPQTLVLLLHRGASISRACSQGHTPLVHALLSNKLQAFQLLKEKEVMFDVDRSFGQYTLLQWATICGHSDIIDAILSLNPNVNSCGISGDKPIVLAAHYNREKLAKTLISMGSEVNVSWKGMTPLMGAIICDNSSIVDILLKNEADINDISSIVGTPLHAAVISSLNHIVKILLEGGANPNATEPITGRAPIHDALQKKSETNFKRLIQYGAKINARDNVGNTPLYLAVSFDFEHIIPYILEKGADINIQNYEGVTPLHCACKNGNYNLVNILIKNGAVMNQKDLMDHSVLLYAVIGGNAEIVSHLLQKEAYKNDENFWTDPFLQAIIHQRDDIINIFLERNVNISKSHLFLADKLHTLQILMGKLPENKINAIIEDVLLNALWHGYDKNLVENLLEKYSPGSTRSILILGLACRNNYPEAVEVLLKKNVKVNEKDEAGKCPMHYAAMGGQERIVRILLKHQADVNATDEEGVTPLYYSTRFGRKEVVKILIQNKAKINIAPSYFFSPLYTSFLAGHFSIATLLIDEDPRHTQEILNPENVKELLIPAILMYELEIVQLLINRFYATKINDENEVGNTLAHFSAAINFAGITKFLLEKGADFHHFNKAGYKPIHISAAQASYENLTYFKSRGFNLQVKNKNGQNLLHCVLNISSEIINYNERERLKIIKFLIDNGVNVNEEDSTGSTPLHLAAENSTVEIIRILLDRGANLFILDKLGRKPVDRAKKQDIKNALISA